MVECQVCDEIATSDAILFHDDIVAFLPKEAATVAHIVVSPKKHYGTIEETPDYIVAWCFAIANKLSAILFNTLKIQGLNLLAEIGTGAGQHAEHFTLNVLPRFENDGLQLKWSPTQGKQEELMQHMEMYRKATANKWVFESKPGKGKMPGTPGEAETIKEDGEKNYLIEQLKRVP